MMKVNKQILQLRKETLTPQKLRQKPQRVRIKKTIPQKMKPPKNQVIRRQIKMLILQRKILMHK